MDLAFPGYTITKPPNNFGNFSIYEARREDDQRSVFIKTPASRYPSPAVIHQLELAYEVAKELDPRLVLEPLSLERWAGNIALVLENSACQALSNLLGTPMETGRFLKIAIGAIEALAEIHRHSIVHKDVKPPNLYVDIGHEGHVRFSGFEIASRLPREHQMLAPLEFIAGTLAYMAPEQTGRMNRSIDSRSDLYSLGITFYEMLTGSLPFFASDPMEWVHCHIARAAIPPAERLKDIPRPISAIVMKLLA
ncbi:MAG: serine/threonine-protein kinase, partial [Bdellovibrionia bacterium]